MPDVAMLLPEPGVVDASALIETTRVHQRGLLPFNAAITDFASELSRRLRRTPQSRDQPALAALAHWIRPASIERLRQGWAELDAATQTVRTPRGVVFHLPPTNVDTLFVYTWVLSALVGNANVIRISPKALDQNRALLSVIGGLLGEHPIVSRTTALVSYDHDPGVTEALSAADLRAVWGGDDTVMTIRSIPRSPHSAELSFPDRFSYTVLDTAAVAALDEEGRRDLAHRVYNDAYWFDQLGCASPRLLVWRGGSAEAAEASERLLVIVRDEIRHRSYEVPASAVMSKLVHLAETAASGRVRSASWHDPYLMLARLTDQGGVDRGSPGGGLFYELQVQQLDDLVEFVDVRDQTLTYFGIAREELEGFARAVGARGIDRIVPVGEALSFDRFWDGRDLMLEFSRCVLVR